MEREIAGAAAEVEDRTSVRSGELPDGTLAPRLIDAGGQQTVRRVVPGAMDANMSRT